MGLLSFIVAFCGTVFLFVTSFKMLQCGFAFIDDFASKYNQLVQLIILSVSMLFIMAYMMIGLVFLGINLKDNFDNIFYEKIVKVVDIP